MGRKVTFLTTFGDAITNFETTNVIPVDIAPVILTFLALIPISAELVAKDGFTVANESPLSQSVIVNL